MIITFVAYCIGIHELCPKYPLKRTQRVGCSNAVNYVTPSVKSSLNFSRE
jgi:hypothetical protein